MEKVRPWCGQPLDRGRLKNGTEHRSTQHDTTLARCYYRQVRPGEHALQVDTVPCTTRMWWAGCRQPHTTVLSSDLAPPDRQLAHDESLEDLYGQSINTLSHGMTAVNHKPLSLSLSLSLSPSLSHVHNFTLMHIRAILLSRANFVKFPICLCSVWDST